MGRRTHPPLLTTMSILRVFLLAAVAFLAVSAHPLDTGFIKFGEGFVGNIADIGKLTDDDIRGMFSDSTPKEENDQALEINIGSKPFERSLNILNSLMLKM